MPSLEPPDGTRPPTGLSAELWEAGAAILEEALDLTGDAREAYLRDACGADTALLAEVQSLLAAAEHGRALSLEPDPPPDAGPSLEPGTALGPWRIDALVARGGMGEVYRAERVDGEYSQTVAIKIVRPGLSSPEFLRRSRAERQILSRLRHEHIVGIVDAGTTGDGRPYLVMPYIEGTAITVYCDAAALDLGARVQLVAQVAEAVHYAHGHLVVHRDLKPSNILVTSSGGVRLLDFGIAKLLGPDDAATGEGSTRSEIRLLTPEHAAPEQVRGGHVTTATDVYALGVLVYQLLSGTRPHRAEGRSMMALERDILEVEPPPVSVAGRDRPWARALRGDLDRITQMALRKEPERRYGSAADLADDLRRWLRGLPVRAESDTLRYRVSKFVRRNRGGVLAGALMLLMLVAFGVSSTVQASRLARERDALRSQQATTRSAVGLLVSFFEKANPTVVPGGDTLRLEQLLAEVDPAIDTLREQPLVQAEMWRTLGKLHAARGRHDRARAYLERAVARLGESVNPDSTDFALMQIELAREVAELEGNAAALPLFVSGRDLLQRHPTPDPKDLFVAEREIATRLSTDSAQREALQRLLGQSDTVATPMERAATVNQIAVVEFNRGDFRAAATAFAEVFRVVDSALPRTHPNRIAVAGNLAAARSRMGEYTVAEASHRSLINDLMSATAIDTSMLGNQLQNLAITVAERGFLLEADSLLRQSIALRDPGKTGSRGQVDRSRFNLALVTAARGRTSEALAQIDSVVISVTPDRTPETQLFYEGYRVHILLEAGRWREAEAWLSSRANTFRKAVASNAQALAALEGWLGEVALRRDQADAALVHFDSATAIARRGFPSASRHVLHAMCARGVALGRLGRESEAAPLLTGACRTYATIALASRTLVASAREAATRIGLPPA